MSGSGTAAPTFSASSFVETIATADEDDDDNVGEVEEDEDEDEDDDDGDDAEDGADLGDAAGPGGSLAVDAVGVEAADAGVEDEVDVEAGAVPGAESEGELGGKCPRIS